jgi:hypothetical protein
MDLFAEAELVPAYSDISNVRELCALGSHAMVFQSEVFAMLACL